MHASIDVESFAAGVMRRDPFQDASRFRAGADQGGWIGTLVLRSTRSGIRDLPCNCDAG